MLCISFRNYFIQFMYLVAVSDGGTFCLSSSWQTVHASSMTCCLQQRSPGITHSINPQWTGTFLVSVDNDLTGSMHGAWKKTTAIINTDFLWSLLFWNDYSWYKKQKVSANNQFLEHYLAKLDFWPPFGYTWGLGQAVGFFHWSSPLKCTLTII